MADVVPVEDGTNIEVQCVYGQSNEPSPGGGYGNADYTIYVVDRDGNATEIKGWPVKPNRTMTPDGTTRAQGPADRGRGDPLRPQRPDRPARDLR